LQAPVASNKFPDEKDACVSVYKSPHKTIAPSQSLIDVCASAERVQTLKNKTRNLRIVLD
jgi:hypothetical protein